MKLARYIPFIGMAFLLLLVQLVALALSEPFEENEFKAFSNPEATSNALYWIGIVLLFTLFIFIVIKLNKRWIIQLVIFLTVVSTFYYVFFALFSRFLPLETNFLLTLILSIGLTAILYKFPEWYVIDFVGIVIGAGASSIFGISLAIKPALVLLILLAVYDYIAVYRTKHMVALAEGVMDLRLPILLVFPKHPKYSFLTEKFDKQEREAFFMGLGDAVIPTVLVISANTFIKTGYYIFPLIGKLNVPAIGTILGTFLGFAVLMGFVLKGKPQAGLPFLNGGAILGFVIGSLAAGSSIF
ncbi:MAG: presenilin family intramembrane aspartyl protease [Candidatus Methanoperedens sp.]|nr:presenilin family intramembrane aspartyl protease [Candidatus Methanoperedens sp.]